MTQREVDFAQLGEDSRPIGFGGWLKESKTRRASLEEGVEAQFLEVILEAVEICQTEDADKRLFKARADLIDAKTA